MHRGDHTDREGVGVAERAADRRDGLADHDARRIAERHRLEGVGARIDPEDADVVEEVVADDPRLDAVPVRELDVDGVGGGGRAALPGGGDHVGARQDGAVGADHESRALAGIRVGGARSR